MVAKKPRIPDPAEQRAIKTMRKMRAAAASMIPCYPLVRAPTAQLRALRKGDLVDGVISRKIVPQLPDTRRKIINRSSLYNLPSAMCNSADTVMALRDATRSKGFAMSRETVGNTLAMARGGGVCRRPRPRARPRG
jgi:hypothetical protein